MSLELDPWSSENVLLISFFSVSAQSVFLFCSQLPLHAQRFLFLTPLEMEEKLTTNTKCKHLNLGKARKYRNKRASICSRTIFSLSRIRQIRTFDSVFSKSNEDVEFQIHQLNAIFFSGRSYIFYWCHSFASMTIKYCVNGLYYIITLHNLRRLKCLVI